MSRRGVQPRITVITLKDYLERLAAQPATLPLRERRARLSCARCDGQLFLLYPDRDAVCAGCGAVLPSDQSSRSN
jgi:hypothetical protein